MGCRVQEFRCPGQELQATHLIATRSRLAAWRQCGHGLATGGNEEGTWARQPDCGLNRLSLPEWTGHGIVAVTLALGSVLESCWQGLGPLTVHEAEREWKTGRISTERVFYALTQNHDVVLFGYEKVNLVRLCLTCLMPCRI